jgi:hypothetical protein
VYKRQLIHAEIRVIPLHTLQDLTGPIGGAVIDDDNLDILVVLVQEGEDRRFKSFLLVTGRNDD